ncbi:hypothetical protein FRB99_005605 [Tulasnella sp. 403]|nr:hypothetical protein FRB99_005605 [Tulasnella sp. 403]
MHLYGRQSTAATQACLTSCTNLSNQITACGIELSCICGPTIIKGLQDCLSCSAQEMPSVSGVLQSEVSEYQSSCGVALSSILPQASSSVFQNIPLPSAALTSPSAGSSSTAGVYNPVGTGAPNVSSNTANSSNNNGNGSSNSNLGAIIGGAVGGTIGGLALLGLIGFLLWKNRKGTQPTPASAPPAGPTYGRNSGFGPVPPAPEKISTPSTEYSALPLIRPQPTVSPPQQPYSPAPMTAYSESEFGTASSGINYANNSAHTGYYTVNSMQTAVSAAPAPPGIIPGAVPAALPPPPTIHAENTLHKPVAVSPMSPPPREFTPAPPRYETPDPMSALYQHQAPNPPGLPEKYTYRPSQ